MGDISMFFVALVVVAIVAWSMALIAIIVSLAWELITMMLRGFVLAVVDVVNSLIFKTH